MTEWLRKKIEEPLYKTLSFVFSVIVTGILCGSFVTEITVDGALRWEFFYKVKSFYGLLLLAIIIYFYLKFLYIEEVTISNFKDDSYTKAYMRKECLPALAEKSRRLIKEGKTTKEIKNIVKDLNL